jgi:membrane protein implicated in regulation of membrane protease activity
MTWATFYLICFVVGVVFSLLSLVGSLGSLHLPASWHALLPHFLGQHPGPIHASHVHVAGAGDAVSAGPVHHATPGGSDVSFFNVPSIMAFLAWFGGTGYLLTRYSDLWTFAAFGLSLLSGLLAATVVFLFLVKVLLAHETQLDPADFDLVGMLGKVNSTIHAGGTGEILFSQGGTRRSAGARSEDGSEIPKGLEVVITRYEKGIAYVRRWDEMTEEDGRQ